MTTLEESLKILREQLERRPLLRWTAANIAGWSVGLLAGVRIAGMLGNWGGAVGSIIGMLLAGAVIGLAVGIAQRWALRGLVNGETDLMRLWLGFSVIGGMIGAASLGFTWYTVVAGDVVFLLMGALFGLGLGWAQTRALRPDFREFTGWWIAANTLGGGLCALFSFSGFPAALPVFCTFGPVAFGLITGLLWQVMAREDDR